MLNGKAYLPFIFFLKKKNSKMKEKKITDSILNTFIDKFLVELSLPMSLLHSS